MSSRKTLYDLLQVSHNATGDVIQAAYEKILGRIELERTTFSSEDSENQLKAVREAYRVLSNAQQRALYDQSIVENEYQEAIPPRPRLKRPTTWIALVFLLFSGLVYYNIHLTHKRAAMAAEIAKTQAEAEKELYALEQERLKNAQTEQLIEMARAEQLRQEQLRSQNEMARIQREIHTDEVNAVQQVARQKLLEEQTAETRTRREQYEIQARAARERASLSAIQQGRDARQNYYGK
jgi:curved DNA-binding protein CbpA